MSESVKLKYQILDLVKRYIEIEHAQKNFIPGVSPVPVSGRVYDSSDVQKLVESSLEFWLTTGRFNSEFEKKLRDFISVKFALTCNSGSSANLLAVTALTSHLLKERSLKPGDEVITCATGFPTTINPIISNQLIPVFVDVDIPTYNIKSEDIEKAISPRTRAIVLAHTLGNPFNLSKIMEVAKQHDLFVIEDCCDALGATYNGQHVGTFGDIGTLSFYPAHHITMGEGGAVFSNGSKLKRILESLRDWGRDCYCEPGMDNTCGKRFDWQLGGLPYGYDHKYTYSHLGYNLKITDMQAAVGVAQLGHLKEFITARRENFSYLYSGLKNLENYFILPQATNNSEPSWFGFPLTIRENSPQARDKLVRHLNDKKIGTRLLFGGNLIHQPYMQCRNYKTIGNLAESDKVMNQTFWIGVYPGLKKPQLDYMLEVIHDYFKPA